MKSGKKPIDELIEISHFYGGDADFVLIGGGNTSLKADDVLYIKASGHSLATIDAGGFVQMDRRKLRDMLAVDLGTERGERERRFKDDVCAARLDPEDARRPSVESLMHELIDDTFVVHTHCTLANMLSSCEKGKQIAGKLFGDEVIWLEYVDPGYTLARALTSELEKFSAKTGCKTPDAIILANHGLVVSGKSFDDIRTKTNRVVEKIRKRLDSTPDAQAFGKVNCVDTQETRKLINTLAPALRALLAEGDNGKNLKIVTFDDSPPVMSLACGKKGQPTTERGALTPDHMVYCGSFPMWFEPDPGEPAALTVQRLREAIADHEKRYNHSPLVILAKGLGMFAAGDAARAVYIDAIKVMIGAERLGGIRPLAEENRKFIEDWEVESYRKNIAKKASASAGRAVGKIAVITGAAQGFGLEIAQDLAEQGACVILADINQSDAQLAADEINKAHGCGRAQALAMDVTDGDSIGGAIDRVVRIFGGIDVFISNAGVLKAGSVKTQPQKDFDFVTAVNYTGYFLCVQKVSPILALQHLARSRYTSDIIQINSKSGLVGSNRNSAYAGGKFGAIGLTQSFALELIEDGIKVNSICPGNFFDGPLWSDADNGLFVQYLRSGKVPGAKTIADVRRSYEAKIPMGRGCRTADVMKAIYYLMDQKYETGQALPVTGGQVMLR